MNIIAIIRKSQFFVAICASMLGAETFIIVGITPSYIDLSAIFLATLFIYNASRLKIVVSGNSTQTKQELRVEGGSSHILICIISLLVLFLVLTACKTQQVLIFMGTAMLSLIYMMPFAIDGRKLKGMRHNHMIKNILLSLIWATATVWFPLAGKNNWDFGQELVVMFLRRFFFIYSLTTIFDIRDLQADISNGMQTMALKLGVTRTKIWASASLAMFCLFVFVDPYLQTPGLENLSYALYLSALFTAVIIAETSINRNKSWYTFVIDGTMALQFLLVLFFKFA